MRLRASHLVLLAVMYFPATTVAQTVSYTYAKGVNFLEYKTYTWVNIEGSEIVDQSLDRDIRRAIEAEIAAKRLVKLSNDNAQLLIAYQVSFTREETIKTFSAWGYGPGWDYGSSYGFAHGRSYDSLASMSTATNSTIYVGNLVIDFYDSIHTDLVWRSMVSKALDFNKDPYKMRQDLGKAVHKLLGPYPPKTTKYVLDP